MYCSKCGTAVPSGMSFCSQCGAPVASAPPSGPTPQPQTPATSMSLPDLSSLMRDPAFWWLFVPTILFLYLARDIGNTLVVAAIGVGLWYARTIPGVPPAIRSYLPLLQALMVFFFLGGNPFVILVVGAALAVAFLQRDPLLALLEPWWQVQQQVPLTTRRVLAFVIPFLIGYLFGQSALGLEWTNTFLSLTIGTIVAFLFLFTPQASLRLGGSR